MSYYKRLKQRGRALSSSKGFTLIELLVVIAIIGILSSVVLASLNGARESSRDARRQTDLQQIRTGLALHHDQNGSYPDYLYSANGSPALEGSGAMTQVPTDPSDGDYAYTNTPSSADADFCIGATLENSGSLPDDNNSDCVSDLGGSPINYAISN